VKNNSNIFILKSFFLLIFLFSSIIGCNPTSTVDFLYEGINDYGSNDNAILFGRIINKDNNYPIFCAQVSSNNPDFYSITDIYGNFSIENIPPGNHSIKVFCAGYKSLYLSNVKLEGNKKYMVDFKLVSVPFNIDSLFRPNKRLNPTAEPVRGN